MTNDGAISPCGIIGRGNRTDGDSKGFDGDRGNEGNEDSDATAIGSCSLATVVGKGTGGAGREVAVVAVAAASLTIVATAVTSAAEVVIGGAVLIRLSLRCCCFTGDPVLLRLPPFELLSLPASPVLFEAEITAVAADVEIDDDDEAVVAVIIPNRCTSLERTELYCRLISVVLTN